MNKSAATVLSLCRRLSLLALVAWLGACSSIQYKVNAPLAAYQPQQGYRFGTLQSGPASDEKIVVMLMFSGGGARAAALGHGVLEELARYSFPGHQRSRRLLDEVRLAYGVSGGSMLAAYYGLKGEAGLADFESRFLNQDLQEKITNSIVSVANLWRLSSPHFGRSDLLEEQLDHALFDGATFDDLLHRRKGPFVVISATDMSSGGRFDFTQDFFDLICSDLGRLPIARAVAASSAVPLLFSPITLRNYAGDCGYQPSEVVLAASRQQALGARAQAARVLSKGLLGYLERERRPYVHLLDGGLSDNLSIRGLLDIATLVDSDTMQRQLGLEHISKYVVVLVNAQNDVARTIDLSPEVPGLLDVARAISDIPINRYTEESELQMAVAIEQWRAGAQAKARQDGSKPPDVYFIKLGLKNMADAAQRETMLNIPTTLYLPKQSVQQLQQAATSLLNESSEFQRLLTDLEAVRQPADPAAAGKRRQTPP